MEILPMLYLRLPIAIATLLAAAFGSIALANTPSDSGKADRAAIVLALQSQYVQPVHVDSVVIEGGYAVVHGRSGPTLVHVGFRRVPYGWLIACNLGTGKPTKEALANRCGFPRYIAAEMGASDAARQGLFQTAAAAQEHAFTVAPPAQRPSEHARSQLLERLNREMQLGQISRSQAIQKWNELRLPWSF
jgi:hypothetical protein